MVKIRLTKKVLKRLNNEASIDDVIYEIYRRAMEDIQRQAKRYLHDRKSVNMVIQKRKDGTMRRLNVIEVKVTDFGSTVIVSE